MNVNLLAGVEDKIYMNISKSLTFSVSMLFMKLLHVSPHTKLILGVLRN